METIRHILAPINTSSASVSFWMERHDAKQINRWGGTVLIDGATGWQQSSNIMQFDDGDGKI